MITISRTCPNCDRVTTVTVSSADFLAWGRGHKTQAAFPNLSASQREAVFISGYCAQCWDELFKED